jgi:fluoroacetyl-CoA thioesterase
MRMAEIRAGLTGRIDRVVEVQLTAAHLGSGGAAVLSTPMMILCMEEASHSAVAQHLPLTQSTVGTVVNIKHLAATPLGMKFHAEAELVEVDRRRLRFRVAAFDEKEKIGEGEHERFIIDVEKFAERLAAKSLHRE